MEAPTLRALAIDAGARHAQTHSERLMVLTSLPANELATTLRQMPADSWPDWMGSVRRIGALDLGTYLAPATNVSEAQAAVAQWRKNATLFLGLLPVPEVVGDPDAPEKTVTVHASAALRDEFLQATQRLASQAPGLRLHAVWQLPPIDSLRALVSPAVQTLALWAGMACLLDMPEALEILIDAFPESMSTAMAMDAPPWAALLALVNQSKSPLFSRSSNASKQISPFIAAMHVSSMRCMTVIAQKRAALGLPCDPPAFLNDTDTDPTRPWSACFDSLHTLCSSQAFVHAMRIALDGKPVDRATSQRFLKMGAQWPFYFEACLYDQMFQGATDTFRHDALLLAMLHAPGLLPTMLECLPWKAIAKHIGSDQSLILRLAHQTPWKGKSVWQARCERALLQLIEQARKDGKTDVLLSTFIDRQSRPKTHQPVHTLSERGWIDTLRVFFDHGVDPKTPPESGMGSLLASANFGNHPSFAMIKSYLARDRAHSVLEEIAPEANRAPEAGMLATRVNLIYARAANGVIGRDGDLPWHLPEDLTHFKRTTAGAPVIMGRRTWDSLPPRFRPLPGRDNIVVTRQAGWKAAGALTADGLPAALALCADAPETWVIGGEQIYAQAVDFARRAIVTEIGRDFEGDTHAPALDPMHWRETARKSNTSVDGLPFDIVTYERQP